MAPPTGVMDSAVPARARVLAGTLTVDWTVVVSAVPTRARVLAGMLTVD